MDEEKKLKAEIRHNPENIKNREKMKIFENAKKM